MDEAKELEKKYEWLQASEIYRKAQRLALDQKDLLKAADLHEKLGFCFYRSAFQAQDNIEFKKNIKQAIREYQEECKLFEVISEENNQPRIKHAKALIFYTKSWLETNIKKRKKLLDDWWTLEKEVLSIYENNNDDQAIGRTCLDLLEGSLYYRFWIHSESPGSQKILVREGFDLAEKAIQTFTKLDEEYDLTKGYCFAIWYIGFGSYFLASKNEIKALHLKALDYLNKSLEISKKNPNAHLLSWIYLAACVAASSCNHDYVSAVRYINKSIKYASITHNNFLINYGKGLKILMKLSLYKLIEDPDKQRETLEKISRLAQETVNHSKIINHRYYTCISYNLYSTAQTNLASIEPDIKIKTSILEKINRLLLKGTEELKDWQEVTGNFFGALGLNYCYLSEIKQKRDEKRELLQEALIYEEKHLNIQRRIYSSAYHTLADTYHRLALIQNGLAIIERDVLQRILLLEKAIEYLKKCIEFSEKDRQLRSGSTWVYGIFGLYYVKLGKIFQQLHILTREKKTIENAIESYKNAIKSFKSTDLSTHLAAAYWHSAQLHDQICDNEASSRDYELASQAYLKATKKIPQLNDFYIEHSLYMRAWSQIEQARYSHSIEDYLDAKQHYEKAAKFHESTSSWSYLAPSYYAWASMEEAESLSRTENTQQAKIIFQKAYEQFYNAEESLKQKFEEITTSDEKEIAQKLFEAIDLRLKYCEVRILMEEAKLLDREGKYLQSSKKYKEAAQNISGIVETIDVETERNELKYLAILCRAWEKMALAEATTSSEAYLEAAELFEQAKEHCFSKKGSLWTLANSNFCRGLGAGVEYQTSLDVKEHNNAKGYMKNAATNYLKAGYRNASEYAKATQRLFDAYLFMNQAESESDTEKRVKQYQLSENLLQLAADSFMKAKQPDKTAQVKQILENVREEKQLAISFNDVLQAPTIASSTSSFSAPTSSEISVGLEKFEHANVQANVVSTVNDVKVGESFCLSVEFVNAGREPALLMRVEDFVPPNFVVVKKPEIYRIEETCLNMKGKQLAPLKLVEVKLVLQPSKKGKYQLNPKVHYLDEVGQNKTLKLKSTEINVEEVILGNRVSTGTQELDSLLLGGIPDGYAVVLTGPLNDEREYLIRNFLETGLKEDAVVFYVSTEADGLENVLENPNFFLFLCNSKPKTQVPDSPNVYKLRGKTDLTNLSILLAKANRRLEASIKKRICVETVSNVLLDYEAKTTCQWISELITDLGSKDFTMLAVMNPSMHPPDQANAVLSLFDGEIELTQTEDRLECKKSIQVKKLRNQDYIKNPICLT